MLEHCPFWERFDGISSVGILGVQDRDADDPMKSA